MRIAGDEQLTPTSRYKTKLVVPDQPQEELTFQFALAALEHAREDGWEEIGVIIGAGVAIFYRRKGAIIVPPGGMQQ